MLQEAGIADHNDGAFKEFVMVHALRPLLVVIVVAALSSGCAVVSIAGAAAGAAISVTGAVVSTGVKVTGKVIEKGIDVVAGGDDEKK